MKKRIRMFSIVLAIVMAFSSMSFAAIAAEKTESDYSYIEKYFAYDYTIWDKSGSNITDEFYCEMSPYYKMGDLKTISEYFSANVGHAESFHITTYTPPPYSKAYAEHYIEWRFYDVISSTMLSVFGKPVNYNEIDATIAMRFGYEDEERFIITADPAYIVEVNLVHQYSNSDPIIMLTNNTYRISDDERSVTYTFTLDITAPVDGSPFYAGWHYIPNYTYTAVCPSN